MIISILYCYLFTQEPKSQLWSKHQQKDETKTHTHKQKTEQGNLYHLDNTISEKRLKYIINAKESKN